MAQVILQAVESENKCPVCGNDTWYVFAAVAGGPTSCYKFYCITHITPIVDRRSTFSVFRRRADDNIHWFDICAQCETCFS